MTWQRFQSEPNTYHISSLTNCLAKAYFERTSPIDEPLASAWAKLRGTMIHYVVRSLGWSELEVKMQFELDAQIITIAGHVDAFDPGTATVYDFKTSRFVKWQLDKGFIPKENHIAQVQCYATLLGQYGIAVSRLVFVYVDDKEIIPKKVSLGNRKQWMIERATVLHQSIEESVPPKPEVGSSCKYCLFLNQCPPSEALVLTEVLR
jgi:CRISPR/Cas system-associated exonuclease Cas4 (RecB family)